MDKPLQLISTYIKNEYRQIHRTKPRHCYTEHIDNKLNEIVSYSKQRKQIAKFKLRWGMQKHYCYNKDEC